MKPSSSADPYPDPSPSPADAALAISPQVGDTLHLRKPSNFNHLSPTPRKPAIRGRRYIREQLAVARSIVVKTIKTDLHGRYVDHVFYAFNNRGIESTFLKGHYLNQELVDRGHGKVV